MYQYLVDSGAKVAKYALEGQIWRLAHSLRTTMAQTMRRCTAGVTKFFSFFFIHLFLGGSYVS